MPVTVNTDLPLHKDREAPWDGAAAKARMVERCSDRDGDSVSPSCMGQAFLWRDPDQSDSNIGAYKFGVADVFAGEVHLVWRGVVAAAAALQGARTPTTVPQAGQEQMKTALNKIYARFAELYDDDSITPPWKRESMTSSADGDDVRAPSPGEGADATAGCCGGCGCGSQGPETEDPPEADAGAFRALLSLTSSADDPSGSWRPPLEHFANPKLTEPTKLTVDADGRVRGHLAPWDQPHIGYDGQQVYPPRSPDGQYRYFRRSQVVTATGEPLAVGLLTMNAPHAGDGDGFAAAASHYDNTATIAAAVNVGEDDVGIWLSGSVVPWLSGDDRTRLELASISGDWRKPGRDASFELIAALSVPNPGFPISQSDDLVRADRLTLAASAVTGTVPGWDEPSCLILVTPRSSPQEILASAVADGLAIHEERRRREDEERRRREEAQTRAARAVTAAAVASSAARRARARSVKSRVTSPGGSGKADDASDGAQDPWGVVAALRLADDRWLVAAPPDAAVGWVNKPGENWVERVGGLPRAIKNVAKWLMLKGWPRSRAIPVAVNVIKKWCRGGAGGDPLDNLNWPGRQRATRRTRMRGCGALAEWHAKRARARAQTLARRAVGRRSR